jgi:hypothetical protein
MLVKLFKKVSSVIPFPAYAALGLPSIFGFTRLILCLFVLIPLDYANYLLAYLYGQTLSYILNFGSVEAILKISTVDNINESKNQFILRFNNLFTHYFVLLAFFLCIIIPLVFIALYFFTFELQLLVICSAVNYSLFNTSTTLQRASGEFVKYGLLNSLRIILLFIPVTFLHFEIMQFYSFNEMLLLECGILLAFPVALSARHIKLNNINKNDFLSYLKHAYKGVQVSVGSFLKQIIFSGERTLAKFMLSSLDFAIYSKWTLLFSGFLIAGSIFSTPLQRQIIDLVNKSKKNHAKNKIFSIHMTTTLIGILIGILASLIANTFFHEYFLSFSSGHLMALIAISFFAGFSFYDSYVLASSTGYTYIKLLILFSITSLCIALAMILISGAWGFSNQLIILFLSTAIITLSGLYTVKKDNV